MESTLWQILGIDITHCMLQLLPTTDLHHLSLVSKASRTIVEPYLYSKIVLKWDKQKTPSLVALVRTLLRRPELALRVRDVNLVRGSMDYPHTYRRGAQWEPRHSSLNPMLSVTDTDTKEVAQVLRGLRVPYWNIWLQAVRLGTMDSFVALLLSQTHRLQSLYIDWVFSESSNFTSRVLRSAILDQAQTQLPDFQDLRRISYQLSDHDYIGKLPGLRTAEFLPLFYLPSLKYLSVGLDNVMALDWPNQTLPVPLGITTLSLDLVREKHLPMILSLVPRLQRFSWQFSYNYRNSRIDPSNSPVIDLDMVGGALEQVLGTLIEFSITAYNNLGEYLEPPPLKIKGSLQGLAKSSRLRKLELPYQFLAASFDPSLILDIKHTVPLTIRHVIVNYDLAEQDCNDGIWLTGHEPWDGMMLYRLVVSWLEDRDMLNSQLERLSFRLNQGRSLLQWWEADLLQPFEQICALRNVKADELEDRPRDWDWKMFQMYS